MTDRPSTSYRLVSLTLAVSFTLVGAAFLFCAGETLALFNSVSRRLGMTESPTTEARLFQVLAVAYMYVVTALAWGMYRSPRQSAYPLLLCQAKCASSVVALALWFLDAPLLVYLATFVVDGGLGLLALVMFFRARAFGLPRATSESPVNLRLRLANLYVPGFLRERKWQQFLSLTARALCADPPSLTGLTWQAQLQQYGDYTRAAATTALQDPQVAEATRRRLFQEALAFGRELRQEFRVTCLAEAMAAASILYRMLQIELRGDPSGGIVISKCLFARFYSAEVCHLMSALDAGVLVGLAGRGRLEFEQRLTEGHACCRARFQLEDQV
ncbi:hypothetical protein ACFL5O_09020 [Myxococcota bacterium]